jgi:hypothetical protein
MDRRTPRTRRSKPHRYRDDEYVAEEQYYRDVKRQQIAGPTQRQRLRTDEEEEEEEQEELVARSSEDGAVSSALLAANWLLRRKLLEHCLVARGNLLPVMDLVEISIVDDYIDILRQFEFDSHIIWH